MDLDLNLGLDLDLTLITAHLPPMFPQSVRINVSPFDSEILITTGITLRPWFNTVEDLKAQAFASDILSQRQQLLLDGMPLQDDGRVLALHGVVAECTIHLVSVCVSKNLLSIITLVGVGEVN